MGPLYTVPFEPAASDPFYQPHQFVTVGLEGRSGGPIKVKFLFDTGSTSCAISATLAQKMGLPVHPYTDERGKPVTLYGKPAVGITVPVLEIGSLSVRKMPLNVLPDENLSDSHGRPIDGILGGNLWRFFAAHLDFTSQCLTLITPTSSLSYSELGSTPINLPDSEIKRMGFSDAHIITLVRSTYLFAAQFSFGNGRHTAGQMLTVDTGSGTTVLSQPVAQQLELEPIFQGKYSAFRPFDAGEFWLPTCRASGLRFDNLLVLAPTEYQESFAPRLGLNVLANYNILFDFPHQKMYLKPRSDLQAITSHQYEVASVVQRQNWAQGRSIITYPTNNRLDSLAIPYDLNTDGLPIVQVRSEVGGVPTTFLLKTSLSDSYLTEPLAKKWGLVRKPAMMSDGTPLTMGGQPLSGVTVPCLRVGGLLLTSSSMVALSPAQSLRAASGLSVEGALGANAFLQGPLLMDPHTRTWMLFVANMPMGPDDLKSVEMADASALDIHTPDNDGIPSFAVGTRQGARQHTGTLYLATGSPFTLLPAEAAQALKLTPEPQKLKCSIGANVTVFNQARVSQLRVGDVVLENVLIAYPDGAMPKDFSPRLGMDVISRLRLLVDMPGKKLYVKKAEK